MSHLRFVLTVLPLFVCLSSVGGTLLDDVNGNKSPEKPTRVSPEVAEEPPCVPNITSKGAPRNITIWTVLSSPGVLPCSADISKALKNVLKPDAVDTLRKETSESVSGLCGAFVNLTSTVITSGYKKGPNLRTVICDKKLLTPAAVEDRDICTTLVENENTITTTIRQLADYPDVSRVFVDMSLMGGDCAEKCAIGSKRVLCNAFFSLAELLSVSDMYDKKNADKGSKTMSKPKGGSTDNNSPSGHSKQDGSSDEGNPGIGKGAKPSKDGQDSALSSGNGGDPNNNGISSASKTGGSSVKNSGLPEKGEAASHGNSTPAPDRSKVIHHLATPIRSLSLEILSELVARSPTTFSPSLNIIKGLSDDLKGELRQLDDASTIVRMFWIVRINGERLRALSEESWDTILVDPARIFPTVVWFKEAENEKEVRGFQNLKEVVTYIHRYRDILFENVPMKSTTTVPSDPEESLAGSKNNNRDEGGENGGNLSPGENGGNLSPGENGDNLSPGENGDNLSPGENGDNLPPGENGRNLSPGENGGNNKNSKPAAGSDILEARQKNKPPSGDSINNEHPGNPEEDSVGGPFKGNLDDEFSIESLDGQLGDLRKGQDDDAHGPADPENNEQKSQVPPKGIVDPSKQDGSKKESKKPLKVESKEKVKKPEEHGQTGIGVDFGEEPDDPPTRSYGPFHFLMLFLIVGGVVVVGYVCMHNRKKLREGFGGYMSSKSKRRRVRDYRPLATSET